MQTSPQDILSATPDPLAPAVWRRLACMGYELVVLFGVVMLTGLFYGAVTQQRHALQGQLGLRVLLVLAIGLYFVVFWVRGGQTLPMKTWHIRLVSRDGGRVTPGRAIARYLLAWLWLLPALAIAHFSGLSSGAAFSGAIAAGILGYAGLTRLHPSRQFWHDVVCGTRLIDSRQPPSAA